MTKSFVPLILGKDVQALFDYVKQTDLDLYQLMQESNLPVDFVDEEQAYLVSERVIQFLSLIEQRMSVEQQVSMCRYATRINATRIVAELELESGVQVSQAIEKFIQSTHLLVSTADFRLEHWLGDLWLTRGKVYIDEAWYRISDTYVISYMIELVRALIGDPNWVPHRVQLQSDATPYLKLLYPNSPIEFYIYRERCGIAISTTVLNTPVRPPGSANTHLKDKDLRSFRSSVSVAIRPYLVEGRPNIERTAEICQLTPRTLQRRLKDEGLSYSQLLDELIFEMARQELVNSNKPIVDISMEMGYSLATHFTRAFKKHHGVSPRAYRLQHTPGPTTKD